MIVSNSEALAAMHGLGIAHLVLTAIWALEFFVHHGPVVALDNWQWWNGMFDVCSNPFLALLRY